MTDLTGRTLGPYELHEEIGHGGMANVYRAVQPSIGREVAVKVLPAHFLQDRTFVERFTREVKVIAKLQHSHILPVYDFGEQDGIPYIVMAYMPGGTLADRIRREGGLPLDEVVRLIEQIAGGLDFAHKKGVIHRDFKPSNVLLDEAGNVHLADFGIAKVTEATAQLTGSGIVGTPAYMAPEMGTAEGLSPLVDVYALGVTLYQLLTGRQPYEAPTPLGVLMAHANQPIPDARLARPDLPDAVQVVVERGMAKNPAERYPSAGALAANLHAASVEARHFVSASPQPADIAPPADTPDTELAPPMAREAAPEARTVDLMETPRPTHRMRRGLSGWALIGTVGLGLLIVIIIGGGALNRLLEGTTGAVAAPTNSLTPQSGLQGTQESLATSEPADTVIEAEGEYLLYVVEEGDDQTLYLQNIDESVPRPIASGYEVFGRAISRDSESVDGILYGISSSQDQPYAIYYLPRQSAELHSIGSAATTALAQLSPDGSRLLVQLVNEEFDAYELLDLRSGVQQTLGEGADDVAAWFIDEGRAVVIFETSAGSSQLSFIRDILDVPQILENGSQIEIFGSFSYFVDPTYSRVVWMTTEQDVTTLYDYDIESDVLEERLSGADIRTRALYAVADDIYSVFIVTDTTETQRRYLLTEVGQRELINEDIVAVSQDGEYVVYEIEGELYLGSFEGTELRRLENGGLVEHWVKFSSDSRYLTYLTWSLDQTNFRVYTASTQTTEAREVARFDAPPDSALSTHGITTWSRLDLLGYVVTTSNETATGGFNISPDGDAVLVFWSWLTGDNAGNHQISLISMSDGSAVVLSEGAGVLHDPSAEWHSIPSFSADGGAVFAVVQRGPQQYELLAHTAAGGVSFLLEGTGPTRFTFSENQPAASVLVQLSEDAWDLYLIDLGSLSVEHISRVASGGLAIPLDR